MKPQNHEINMSSEGADVKDERKDPVVKEAEINQILQWGKAHEDSIRSIQYIDVTDEPLIMTSGLDKFVHIWCAVTGEKKGTLKQGYMMLRDYKWEFGMRAFDNKLSTRQETVKSFVYSIKDDQDNEKRQEKVRSLRQTASVGGLSRFQGAALTGMQSTKVDPMNYSFQSQMMSSQNDTRFVNQQNAQKIVHRA